MTVSGSSAIDFQAEYDEMKSLAMGYKEELKQLKNVLKATQAYRQWCQPDGSLARMPEDYQKRVKSEAQELDCKLGELNSFLSVQSFGSSTCVITEQASDLLIEQSVHMTAYLGVLRKRIKMFRKP